MDHNKIILTVRSNIYHQGAFRGTVLDSIADKVVKNTIDVGFDGSDFVSFKVLFYRDILFCNKDVQRLRNKTYFRLQAYFLGSVKFVLTNVNNLIEIMNYSLKGLS